jgi:hypothetical protein
MAGAVRRCLRCSLRQICGGVRRRCRSGLSVLPCCCGTAGWLRGVSTAAAHGRSALGGSGGGVCAAAPCGGGGRRHLCAGRGVAPLGGTRAVPESREGEPASCETRGPHVIVAHTLEYRAHGTASSEARLVQRRREARSRAAAHLCCALRHASAGCCSGNVVVRPQEEQGGGGVCVHGGGGVPAVSCKRLSRDALSHRCLAPQTVRVAAQHSTAKRRPAACCGTARAWDGGSAWAARQAQVSPHASRQRQSMCRMLACDESAARQPSRKGWRRTHSTCK